MRQRLLLLPIILGFSLIALDLAVQARQRAAFDPEAFEAAAKGYEAEILRDALGVPHIYVINMAAISNTPTTLSATATVMASANVNASCSRFGLIPLA